MTQSGRRNGAAAGVLLAALLVFGLGFAACSQPEVTGPIDPGAIDDPERLTPQIREATVDPRTIDEGDRRASQVGEVNVGPARRECYGPFRRMCLIVDGGFFYEEIDGFTHEPGYEYRLRIERYDAFPGHKGPPQDAGRYGYRLVEVLSMTRAEGSTVEVTVAPTRVQCPKSDERCLLVDGRPVRNSIDGFQYAPGFQYRMRIETFESDTRRLVAVIGQEPVNGEEVKIAVGPWRVGCYADAPITAACIVVNGEPYYGVIEEFPRRHGFEYRLRVERYDLFPGEPEAPAELPRYGYRLLAVLSEMATSNPPSGS